MTKKEPQSVNSGVQLGDTQSIGKGNPRQSRMALIKD